MLDVLNQVNSWSTLGGAILGYMKASQMNQHELQMLRIKGQYAMTDYAHTDKSMSAKYGRFLLVGSILFMIAYIIIVTLAKDIPITVETVQSNGWLASWLHGPTRHVYTTLRGAVIPDWMPQLLFISSGYWFGAQRRL